MEELIKRSIELCAAVYRVTDKFPKEEALRQKLRELSICFIDFLCYDKRNPTSRGRVFSYHEVSGSMSAFMAYAEVAKRQNWVSPSNFDILICEYENLAKNFEKFCNAKSQDEVKNIHGGLGNSVYSNSKKDIKDKKISRVERKIERRRARILEFLKRKEKGVSVLELAKNLRVSTKTIERHLRYLISQKMARKEGSTRSLKFFAQTNK